MQPVATASSRPEGPEPRRWLGRGRDRIWAFVVAVALLILGAGLAGASTTEDSPWAALISTRHTECATVSSPSPTGNVSVNVEFTPAGCDQTSHFD